jgi:hypothetical protein
LSPFVQNDNTLHDRTRGKISAPTTENAKHFALLEKLKKTVGAGAVLCLRSSPLPLSKSAVALPIWEI